MHLYYRAHFFLDIVISLQKLAYGRIAHFKKRNNEKNVYDKQNKYLKKV
jgi:hypothetical protein